MKNFWSKWFISASSGFFGKFVLALTLLIAGTLGTVYLLPKDNVVTTAIAGVIPTITIIITTDISQKLL